MNDNKTSKNSIVAKFAVPISFLILFFLAIFQTNKSVGEFLGEFQIMAVH